MSPHNIVVLRGTLTGTPRTRDLASGRRVAQFDVTTTLDDHEPAASVPVAWFDPPPAGLPVDVGDEVVVVGSVQRRFFRAAGATQSRTEVVAERVVPATKRREVTRALDGARRALE